MFCLLLIAVYRHSIFIYFLLRFFRLGFGFWLFPIFLLNFSFLSFAFNAIILDKYLLPF